MGRSKVFLKLKYLTKFTHAQRILKAKRQNFNFFSFLFQELYKILLDASKFELVNIEDFGFLLEPPEWVNANQ